ncbi:MAG: TRAP transporter fused permease subunit [Desulfobacteraceae bacterium]|nr:MAG: TRAP transporter fused permease subunit [Desulfobacteraceae bacterium]
MAFGSILKGGKRRKLPRSWSLAVSVLVLALGAFEVYAAPFGKLDTYILRAMFLGFIFALSFICFTFSPKSREDKVPLADIILGILGLSSGLFILLNGDKILSRWTGVDPMGFWDIFFTASIVVLVLEVTRRTVGAVLILVILAFVAYNFVGQYLPGSFGHRGMTLIGFLDRMVYTFDGIFSAPIGVACTYVYMFVLFGQVFNRAGGGDFFFRLASAIAGRMRGGPAKIAVIASAMYGTMSGSPVSDVVTTGSITIPLMKRLGYSPVFAGAVEASASSGASILPPIMGTAAFLMVDIAGISYTTIAVAAVIPAVIYYFGIMLQVHYRAITNDLRPILETEKRESAWTVLRENWQYLIPVAALVWLISQRLNPTVVGLASAGVTIVVSWTKPGRRMGPRAILDAFHRTGTGIVTVANASAAAGLVIGGIMLTGLGGKFTSLVFQATGGSGFLCLLLVAAVCIILGMGMPIPAAYVLTATLAVPALLEMDFPLFSSHLFIVYFSVASAITPPVAVAAYAGASISGGDPNATGFQAIRLSIAAYLAPVIFMYRPGLILHAGIGEIIWTTLVTILATAALASLLEGYLYRRLSFFQKMVALAGSFFLVWPSLLTDLVGIGVIAGLVVLQLSGRRERARQPSHLGT